MHHNVSFSSLNETVFVIVRLSIEGEFTFLRTNHNKQSIQNPFRDWFTYALRKRILKTRQTWIEAVM